MTSTGASFAASPRRCASDGRSGGAVLRSAGAGPLAPLPSPGLAGLRSGAGMSESSFIVYLSLRRGECGGTGWIQIFPDPTRELARVAGADGFELGGDAVAWAEFDLAAQDAGLEAVQRADRRAADDFSFEVVDAAVAGADEVPCSLDEPDRAAEMGAAVGHGDVFLRVLAE